MLRGVSGAQDLGSSLHPRPAGPRKPGEAGRSKAPGREEEVWEEGKGCHEDP